MTEKRYLQVKFKFDTMFIFVQGKIKKPTFTRRYLLSDKPPNDNVDLRFCVCKSNQQILPHFLLNGNIYIGKNNPQIHFKFNTPLLHSRQSFQSIIVSNNLSFAANWPHIAGVSLTASANLTISKIYVPCVASIV